MGERWPALMTTAEACEYLSIGETTLRQLRASRQLPSVTIKGGSLVRFRRSDLDLFIERLPEGIGRCEVASVQGERRA